MAQQNENGENSISPEDEQKIGEKPGSLQDSVNIGKKILSITGTAQELEGDLQKENELQKLQYFQKLRDWLLNEMIRLNNAETDSADVSSQFHIAADHFVSNFPLLSLLDRGEARKAIQYLGFIFSSLERHTQAGGASAGEGLTSVKGAKDLFLALSEKAEHPPRDSLYTFSLWNADIHPVITFSGDPQEQLFIDVVAKSTDYLDKAASLARNIKDDFDEDDLDLLKQICIYLDKAREEFIRFLKKNEQGETALTADFFANIMRQYNCRWVIDEVEWGGPTAANCAPYIALDYLIGTSDLEYDKHVLERLRYMTTEDQELLKSDIGNPSIARKILKKIGLEVEDFLEAEEGHLARILAASDHCLINFVKAFNDIVEKFSLLSGLHFGLIRKFLLKPTHSEGKQSEGRPLMKNVVDNEKGLSGMSFEHVARIREMRRSNLVLKKLNIASQASLK